MAAEEPETPEEIAPHNNGFYYPENISTVEPAFHLLESSDESDIVLPYSPEALQNPAESASAHKFASIDMAQTFTDTVNLDSSLQIYWA